MSAFSEFLSLSCTITTVFFTLLFLELVTLVRSMARTIYDSDDRPITTTQYLKLIEKKNPASRYKTGSPVEPRECAVCLSAFVEGEKIRKLKKCKHTFHKDCLDTWLQLDKATCPLCRRNVLPEEIVIRHRRRRNQEQSDGSDEELVFFSSSFRGNTLRRLM